MRVALDNSDVFQLGLDTFGFTVSEQNSEIIIDGSLNLELFFKEVLEDNTVLDTMRRIFELTAPAGTVLTQQENGSTMVLSGGPLSYSLTAPNNNGVSVVNQVIVNAGECADDAEVEDSDFVIVGCL